MGNAEDLKRAAAAEAVSLVESGMRLGLGTGSTVAHFLELLAERLAEGSLSDVVGVATSIQTTDRAHALGIPLEDLPGLSPLHLVVDGADEFDPSVDLIKGLGGALLREKMVAREAERFVVIVDEGKRVTRLGEKAPLPVEVVAFAWQVHLPFLESLGARPELRMAEAGAPFTTDNGNYCIDCRFDDGIADPADLEERLARRSGIVETGLFLGMAERVLVATPSGVETIRRDSASPARTGAPGGAT